MTDDDGAVDELATQIVALAGRPAAATCRWLLLVAEFDASDGAARSGLASTAAWLSYACGVSRRTGFEHVRVAQALAVFPRLAEEMATGRLSYSQVRAISRVPEAGEWQLVEDLIHVAQYGSAAQLEVLVRGLRTADTAERPITEPPLEDVRSGWDENGRWRQSARLAEDRGALVDGVLTAISAAEGVSRADALVRMAEIAQVALNDSERPPRALRGDARAAIVVDLDADRVRQPDGQQDQECSAEHSPDANDRSGSRRRGQCSEEHSTAGRPDGRIARGPELPAAMALWFART
ncbi:MAG: hypothetical protein ACR2KJ_13390, partial [Jatrophihabitans sp.]